MLPDGQGTWTEAGGSYCTGAANSTECKMNYGRSANSGTAIGGRGICPPNWHVPTDFELGVMLDVMESGGGTTHQTATVNGTYIGIDAGTRVKASCNGTSSDTNPVWDQNGAGTDPFNFRGIPSDDRNWNGTQDGNLGASTLFWSSTAYSSSTVWRLGIIDAYAHVYRTAANRLHGNSVRCVRDE
jgi:uncharacterized protein (TIGR02145 family)